MSIKWPNPFAIKEEDQQRKEERNILLYRKQYARLLLIALTLEGEQYCPMAKLPAEMIKHILEYIPRKITIKEHKMPIRAGERTIRNVMCALDSTPMDFLERKIRRKYKGKHLTKVTFHRNNNNNKHVEFLTLRDFANGFRAVEINPLVPPENAPYISLEFRSCIALGRNNVATGLIAF